MKLNPIIILAFGLLIIMPAVVLAAFDDEIGSELVALSAAEGGGG